jgi:hypothetical protein
MLDVFIFVVESTEKNETTSVDCWNENMKMIIEFDFKICFFVEDMIDLMINRFINVSKMKKNDFFRFFLIQITDETR